MAAAGRKGGAHADIELAPVILIKGKEGLLIDRALAKIRHLAFAADPNLERTEISAPTYTLGHLDVITSPSLFGESRLITVSDAASMSDDFAKDFLTYLEAPAADVWIVLIHPGGNARGKKVIDAIAKAGFPVVAADEIKRDQDKVDLIRADVKAAKRSMDVDAMRAIVDALGSDLRAMAAAVAQLLSDVEGTITVNDVHRYYSGRVEATGFAIADAAFSGQSGRALTLLRHAFVTGVDPLLIIGALASKARTLAKVASAPQSAISKLPPWQVDKARRELRLWSEPALAQVITALAVADEELKGASKDREHAVEKVIITICRLAAR